MASHRRNNEKSRPTISKNSDVVIILRASIAPTAISQNVYRHAAIRMASSLSGTAYRRKSDVECFRWYLSKENLAWWTS